jgi:hypothetical protein
VTQIMAAITAVAWFGVRLVTFIELIHDHRRPR